MSLGFRPRHDHIAERLRMGAPALPAPAAQPEPVGLQCGIAVPRGLLPVLVYSGLAFTVPFLYLNVAVDFTATGVRAGVIALAFVAALVTTYANSCEAWYNMALFFHTAIEVYAVQLLIDFAYLSTTSAAAAALAITTTVVIISHLIPFFLTDRVLPLGVLGTAGVVVNAATFVHLAPSQLLLGTASAIMLLSLTLIIGGICETPTSLLTLLVRAVREGSVIKVGGYEL